MNKVTSKQSVNPDPSATIGFQQPFQDASELDAYVRQAARTMIQQAIDLEVQQFLDAHADRVDNQGRRYVIRNGHLPERQFLIAAGPIEIRQPACVTSPQTKKIALFLRPNCCPDISDAAKPWTTLSPGCISKAFPPETFRRRFSRSSASRSRT